MVARKLLLIGAGRHADRIYLPLLADLIVSNDVELTGVIELSSRATTVGQLLCAHGLPPVEVSEIDESCANDPVKIGMLLNEIFAKCPFDAMLIANDPRNRAAYFDFACTFKIDVFVDKPIFALESMTTAPERTLEYTRKLEDLAARVAQAGICFMVQTQRRDHPGYLFVLDKLNDCINRFNVPVTSLHIQHADGMWVLPDEWEREHHPYKYGYGKLFHSGYHFVDLMVFLLRSTLAKFQANKLEIAAKPRSADESLAIWDKHPELPPHRNRALELRRDSYGEQDLSAIIDFQNDGGSICVADLSLLQNSFSDRNPKIPVVDSYKGIGRVRHERLDLKLSSLMNIQVHSYQSRSTGIPVGTGVGESDHFEILIFRNPHFFTEKPFERINISDLIGGDCKSVNERARVSLFKKFLTGETVKSGLNEHVLSGQITSLLYEAIADAKGGIGFTRGALDRSFLTPRISG